MDVNNAIWAKGTSAWRCLAIALVVSVVATLGLTNMGSPARASGPRFGTTLAPGGVTPTAGPHANAASAAGSLARPVVGAAATPTGKGYWLVASDGGIFSFGDAAFLGSTGATPLNRPITGMAATPTGKGYWLVASDGGIFSFGDARFFGSTGGAALNRPIVGMTANRTGRGYWFVANDGGIFAFGDAAFYGSAGGVPIPTAIVGMAGDGSGHGYWLAGADGSVFTFGDAQQVGSAAGVLGQQVSALAAPPSGAGLWLAGQQGASVSLPSMTVNGVGGVGGGGGSSTAYSFLASNPDGSPIRWNPCQPIHYVTNLAQAPANAAADIGGALARVTSVTGIPFVNDGSTNEVPVANRPAQQARYGSGWAPVLIAWSTAGQSNLLPGGGVVGEGGATWISPGGGAPSEYVTGVVVVDASASASLAPGFGGGLTTGDLLLHEIGHVLGLGHTADRSQVMYPDIVSRPTSAYGAGDSSGLARLGAGAGCIATPAP